MFKKLIRMTPTEKRDLIVQLQRSMGEDDEYISADERYRQLLKAAEKVFEMKMNTKSREANNVMIRRFIAYKMRSEGFSFQAIGRVMNRSHASIIYLVNQVKDYFSLPNAYKEETEKYILFSSLTSLKGDDDEL